VALPPVPGFVIGTADLQHLLRSGEVPAWLPPDLQRVFAGATGLEHDLVLTGWDAPRARLTLRGDTGEARFVQDPRAADLWVLERMDVRRVVTPEAPWWGQALAPWGEEPLLEAMRRRLDTWMEQVIRGTFFAVDPAEPDAPVYTHARPAPERGVRIDDLQAPPAPVAAALPPPFQAIADGITANSPAIEAAATAAYEAARDAAIRRASAQNAAYYAAPANMLVFADRGVSVETSADGVTWVPLPRDGRPARYVRQRPARSRRP